MAEKFSFIFKDDGVAVTAAETIARGIGEARHLSLYLDVSAASGTTPTLDIDIQEQDPESGTWYTLSSFAQATGVTNERIVIADINSKVVRADVTLGGVSPSFTYSLVAAGAG